MKPKNTKIWIFLMAAPIPVLILNAILQLVTRAAIGSSEVGQSDGLTAVLNIFSLLIGVFAVIGLLGLPVWIIMYIQATKHNNLLKQQASQPNLQNNDFNPPQPPQTPVSPV
jgi:hypothetical protein